MFLLSVLALHFYLVSCAPSDPTHGLDTGGGPEISDTFRPRFPGADNSNENSESNLALPHLLDPNTDTSFRKPLVESSDVVMVQKQEGVDSFPKEKIYESEAMGITDDSNAQNPVDLGSLPDTQVVNESPAVYPVHPIDGYKVPIDIIPSGPKSVEPPTVISVTKPVATDTSKNSPNYDDDEPEIPVYAGADIKPGEILPVDVTPDSEEKILNNSPPDTTDKTVKPVVSQPEEKTIVSTPTINTVCTSMGLRKFLHFMNKAGYKDMLTRKRPLTIFAPSDDAWDELPLPVLNRLQRDRGFLQRLLRYHIVDGIEKDQTRRDYYCPSMQQGMGLFVNTHGKNTYVNGVPAVASSVQPSNGEVYVLPRVLLPFPVNNLAEAIQTTGTFTRFYTLAAETGLLDKELADRGPYTLFAPTDEAFNRLPFKTLEWLSWDKEATRDLLLKHLVPGTHYSSSLPNEEGRIFQSLNGESLELKHSELTGEILVNGAHLLKHDLTTKNGVLQGVDEVLFSDELIPRPFVRPILKTIYG